MELDKNHIYCPACCEIVKLGISDPYSKAGKCTCGLIIREWNNGTLEWGRVQETSDKRLIPGSYGRLKGEI